MTHIDLVDEESRELHEFISDVSKELSTETPTQETTESNWDEQLKIMMDGAYTKGLAVGMKTMCGMVLDTVQSSKKINPAKIVNNIKRNCTHHLGKATAYEKKINALLNNETVFEEVADEKNNQ